MGFCTFSSVKVIDNKISIDNTFVCEYMPNVAGDYTKVYLYGLYLCSLGDVPKNTLDDFAYALKLSKTDVMGAFQYWQDVGLVTILDIETVSVKYLPVKRNYAKNTEIPKKYADFCKKLQEILPKREITTAGYNELITFLDQSGMQSDALLMISAFCAKMKNDKGIGYNYILTIAKDWSKKNILSVDDVENELQSRARNIDELKLVLNAMKIKRQPNFDEVEIWNHITKELGFELSLIIDVAKKVKITGNKMNYLQAILEKYYTMQITSVTQAQEYEVQKDLFVDTAKNVIKNLGLYYQNIEPVVENYIAKWYSLGFETGAMIELSKWCFMNSVRSLEAMDIKVNEFIGLGLITTESIKQYITQRETIDKEITVLLQKLEQNRRVNNFDRDMYNNWKFVYNISDELMDFAINQGKGKFSAMQYINKLLAYYHTNNIVTVEGAKKCHITFNSVAPTKPVKQTNKINTRSFDKESIDKLFTNVNDVKI